MSKNDRRANALKRAKAKKIFLTALFVIIFLAFITAAIWVAIDNDKNTPDHDPNSAGDHAGHNHD